MPIKSFRNIGTADLAAGKNTKDSRRVVPQTVIKAAQKKLDLLNSAATLEDLAKLPGANLENLKHTMPGFYCIRVNDQYRIFFRFNNGEASDVFIEDKHGR